MLNLIPLIYELRFRIRWDQPLAVIVETWRQTSTGRECWPGNHQRSRSPKTGEVKTSTQEPWRGTSYPHMKPMTSRMHPKLMFTGCSKVSAIHVEPFGCMDPASCLLNVHDLWDEPYRSWHGTIGLPHHISIVYTFIIWYPHWFAILAGNLFHRKNGIALYCFDVRPSPAGNTHVRMPCRWPAVRNSSWLMALRGLR